jgi:hypothetical protein
MKRSSLGQHLASTLILLASVGGALFLILNRQTVLDQITLMRYEPQVEIVGLADRTTMTEKGRSSFYASQPSLEGSQQFSQICGNNEQGTAVLGCYANRQIYIFNVTDTQLDGIREVTAAHEMLHAAYDRMSDDERARVDQLLEVKYEELSNDQAFADRMAYYAKAEPGERDNELHSIIGTEVRSIDPELEAHYRRYFSNRAAVVDLHDKYSAIFVKLKQQSEVLSNRLNILATSIEQASEAYNVASRQLNQDISTFNGRANRGEFESQAEFSAERQRLSARSSNLAGDRQSINNMISEYNQLRDNLAAIATQTEALNRSIDSSLAPAPSL